MCIFLKSFLFSYCRSILVLGLFSNLKILILCLFFKASAANGGVDEDTFLNSFEAVPKIQVTRIFNIKLLLSLNYNTKSVYN